MPLVWININNIRYKTLEANWARLRLKSGKKKMNNGWWKKKTHGVTWKSSKFGWIIPTLKRGGLSSLFTMWLHCKNMKTSTLKPHLLLMPSHARSLSLYTSSTHMLVYCMRIWMHILYVCMCACVCVLDFTHLFNLCPLPLLYPPHQLFFFWSFYWPHLWWLWNY